MKDLLGLASAKRALAGLYQNDAAVHAVLWFGEEGSGKSALAEMLAKFWLCLSPTPNGACGACRSCEAASRGRAVDRLDVFPRGASNWIHLAAIQNVPRRPLEYENVIPIQDFFRTMPLASRRKVVVVMDADRLYPEAVNSLLKLLEEPPEYARFVLTTSEISRIRPTVRSRCMAVPCQLPDDEEWNAVHSDLEPWEQVLAGRAGGRLARIRRSPEIFRGLYDLAGECAVSRRDASLSASDRFRKLVDALSKSEESNARHAGTSALAVLAAAMAHHQAPESALRRVALAHRRIAGNVSSALEFDALFAAISANSGRGS
jgi:hypothetical protein